MSLRCRKCGDMYGLAKYGNRKDGFRFYSFPQDVIEATDQCVVDRRVFRMQCALMLHCWTSFEGFAEALNETYDCFEEGLAFTNKQAASCFWWGEVEEELREMDMCQFRFHHDSDREICMQLIEKKRRGLLYPHTEDDCSDFCKSRGCGRLYVTDGIWKLQFQHCMFSVKNTVNGIDINYPDVCTGEVRPGQAFCMLHSEVCEKAGLKTGLREFLEQAGAIRAKELKGEVGQIRLTDEAAQKICDALPSDAPNPESSVECQGVKELISQGGKKLAKTLGKTVDVPENRCEKDLGDNPKMRRMSRGHQFIIRGGGHIETWSPLFVSESVGQTFLILIAWLFKCLKESSLPMERWNEIILAYDNMCQLLTYKASSKKLPFPKPYDTMFQKITKVIDELHLKNHKQESCKIELHPRKIGEIHPDLADTKNTQVCEQTFVWLGKYKKIVCSMPKTHHLFFIHRIVKRRNKYTSRCHRMRRRMVLPGVKIS